MSAVNPDHPMSQVAQQNAIKFLALTIWKLRRHCPNLAVEISLHDMNEMIAAFLHGGQQPVVAFIGAGDKMTLQLVDATSGKELIVNQSEKEIAAAKGMAKMLDARRRAQSVADRLLSGQPSHELLREPSEILKLLTWEPDL